MRQFARTHFLTKGRRLPGESTLIPVGLEFASHSQGIAVPGWAAPADVCQELADGGTQLRANVAESSVDAGSQ